MSYNLKQQYANSLPRYLASLTAPYYPERPQPPKDDRLFQAYRTPTTFDNQIYIGFKPDVPRPLFPGWSSSNQVLKDDTSLKSGFQRQENKLNDRTQSNLSNQGKGSSSTHTNTKPIQIMDQSQQKCPSKKQYISAAQKTSKQILKNKQIGIQSSLNQKYTQNILNSNQDKYFNNNLINLNNNQINNNSNNKNYSYPYNINPSNINHGGISAYGVNGNQFNLTHRYDYTSRDDGILGNNRSNSQPSVYEARSFPKAFLQQQPATQKYYDPSTVTYNSFLEKYGLNNANYIQQTYGNIENYHQYLKQRYGQYLNISSNNPGISSLPQNNPINLPLQKNILKQTIPHRPHYNNSIIVPPQMNSFFNNSNISISNNFDNNSYLNNISGSKNIMSYYLKTPAATKYEDTLMKQYNKNYNYNNINNTIQNNNPDKNTNKILQQKDQLIRQIKNDKQSKEKLGEDFTLLGNIKIEFQRTNGNFNRLKSKSNKNKNAMEIIQLIDSDDNEGKEGEREDGRQNFNIINANNNTNQSVYNANSSNMAFNTQHLSQKRQQKIHSPYFNHPPASNHPSSHPYCPSYHQSGKQYKQHQPIPLPYLQKTKPISKFNQPSKFFKENKHDLSRQKLEDLRKMKQCRKYQEDLTNSLNTPPVHYKNGSNSGYGLMGDAFSNNSTGIMTKNSSSVNLGNSLLNAYNPVRMSRQQYSAMYDSIKAVNENLTRPKKSTNQYINYLKTNNKNYSNKDIDQVINNLNKQAHNTKQNGGQVRSIEELKLLEQLYGEQKNFTVDGYINRSNQSAFNVMKDKNSQSSTMNYMQRFKHSLLGNVVNNNSQIDGKVVNLIPSSNSIISNKQITGNQHVRKQAQKAYLKSRTRLINTSNNIQVSQINSQQKNITAQNSFQKKRSNMVSALNSSTVGDKNKNQFGITSKNIQGVSQSSKILKQTLTAEERAALTIQWTPKLKKLKQLIKRRQNDSVIMIGPEFQAQLPQFITDSDKLKTLVLIKRSNLMKRMYCCN